MHYTTNSHYFFKSHYVHIDI